MKTTNYSYVGIAFIVLVFGIIFIPKIIDRIHQPINRLVKFQFEKMFLEDKLYTALPNINSWLLTNFNQLNRYAEKTNE